MVVTKHKYGIEMAAAETAKNAPVEGAREAQRVGVAGAGQEFILVAIEERNVPFDAHAELGVMVAEHRDIAAEERGQIDVRLLGDATKQRSLVLDGVGDKIGQAQRTICGKGRGPLKWREGGSCGMHWVSERAVLRAMLTSPSRPHNR